MRDEERYPIPVDTTLRRTNWEESRPEFSLPQVSVASPVAASYHGNGLDMYLAESQSTPQPDTPSPCKVDGAFSPQICLEKGPPRRKTIFGLRRRVFWLVAGIATALVVVGAVVGAVVGSSRIGGAITAPSATPSATPSAGPMSANARNIAAATMNMTGSTSTNVQVVYQDLDTTDLLYQLIWNYTAAGEQRLSLSPSPQQETPIAVTTSNMNADNGIVTSVFYLSVSKDNSSLSDICQATLQCSLGAPNCTVLNNEIISGNASQEVIGTSGLAATLLSDTSETRVYYKGGGGAVRALVGNEPAINAWQDIWIGSQSFAGSGIGVNFDAKQETIQVVWVHSATKELQEITYTDATSVFGITSTAVTSSDPKGWSADAKFSSCFQPGLDQHHIFYVASTGNIYALWRADSNASWTSSHTNNWGYAVGGIASVAWDSQVRLLYMTGEPPVLSMAVNNNSDWSVVQAL